MNRLVARCRWFLLAAVAANAPCPVLEAQANKGRASSGALIEVRDPSGAAVPGLDVLVLDLHRVDPLALRAASKAARVKPEADPFEAFAKLAEPLVTGPDGRVRLAAFSDGTLLMARRGPLRGSARLARPVLGKAPHGQRGLLLIPSATDVVVWTLYAATPFTVRVTDATGAPAGGLAVTVVEPQGKDQREKSSSSTGSRKRVALQRRSNADTYLSRRYTSDDGVILFDNIFERAPRGDGKPRVVRVEAWYAGGGVSVETRLIEGTVGEVTIQLPPVGRMVFKLPEALAPLQQGVGATLGSPDAPPLQSAGTAVKRGATLVFAHVALGKTLEMVPAKLPVEGWEGRGPQAAGETVEVELALGGAEPVWIGRLLQPDATPVPPSTMLAYPVADEAFSTGGHWLGRGALSAGGHFVVTTRRTYNLRGLELRAAPSSVPLPTSRGTVRSRSAMSGPSWCRCWRTAGSGGRRRPGTGAPGSWRGFRGASRWPG